MTTDPDEHTAPPVTSRPADILLVEDSPSDAAMIVHALREGAPATGCGSWVTVRTRWRFCTAGAGTPPHRDPT